MISRTIINENAIRRIIAMMLVAIAIMIIKDKAGDDKMEIELDDIKPHLRI